MVERQGFWERVKKVREDWFALREMESSPWFGMDGLCFVVGQLSDEEPEPTRQVLQKYFFGIMMTNTVVVFTKEKVIILSGGKKIAVLEPLRESKFKLEDCEVDLLTATKDNVDSLVDQIIASLKTSFDGKKLGMPLQDKKEEGSKFVDRWNEKLAANGIEPVDFSNALSSVMMIKSQSELKTMREASGAVERVMKKVFLKEMENQFEEDLEKTHAAIAGKITEAFQKPEKLKLKNVTAEDIEVPLEIQVQSSGKYDFSRTAKATAEKLEGDVIICQITARVREYFAQIARTFFIDPNKDQEKTYQILEKAHEMLVRELRPGAELGAIYDAVAGFVEKENAALKPLLNEVIGYGQGMQATSDAFKIASGNKAKVQAGMSFATHIGFKDVPLTKPRKTIPSGKYSCLISNMVEVGELSASVITSSLKYDFDEVQYELDNEDEESDDSVDSEEKRIEDAVRKSSGKRVTRSKTKSKAQIEAEKKAANLEYEIAMMQAKLMQQKAKKALNELEDDADGDNDDNEEGEDGAKEFTLVYRRAKDYPMNLTPNQIHCDKENLAVLLPVGGFHVPFHVSAIKTVNKTDEEGGVSVMRINFFYPTGGHTFARDVPQMMRSIMQNNPQLNFIKEMSFRARDNNNLNRQYRAIKDMQKKLRQEQKQREQEKDIVIQDDLVLLHARDGKRPPTLDDVSMRPPIKKGKCVGRLQAHQNGMRFRTSRNEVFDIIYGNIKHFILQECKNELTVLIHFNLKNPVLIGKGKTYDVQFYTEVVEASSALDGARRNIHDPDEEEEERRERLLKKRLNEMFRKFCKSVVKVAEKFEQNIGQDNDFDTPFPKLAFRGVPHKEMVTIYPTVHCLVNLTETPFFLVSLDEIEHVHFERVNNHTKNFDIVLILKSHMKPNGGVPQRVTSVPIENLDMIRKWLNEKGDITFTAGISALNWKNVMEGVYDEIDRGIFWRGEDEQGIKKDVGWNFLKLVGDDEEDGGGGGDGGGAGGDGGDSESDFQEDSEESEQEESDFSEDDEDEPSSGPASEDDESGEDWDELEKKALESDRKKDKRDEQVGDIRPKKKQKTN